MKSHEPVIIVHGGAGEWPTKLHTSGLTGVRIAADHGFEMLSGGGTALDAVEAAIVSMEDNPTFNAGTGSSLNLLGDVEADAGIMDGKTLNGGAVALLRGIKNPIRVARIVMEKTDHVLVAGDSARKLAVNNRLAEADLRVPRRIRIWKEGMRKLRANSPKRTTHKRKTILEFLRNSMDTVGALAQDNRGNLAAGDSTGGVSLKFPGRIGDSPILGAGLHADNKAGAATATGIGEQAIRLSISKVACDLMRSYSAQAAALRTIRYSTSTLGSGMGIITLDRKGSYGVAHNTKHLCWAVKSGRISVESMTGNRFVA